MQILSWFWIFVLKSAEITFLLTLKLLCKPYIWVVFGAPCGQSNIVFIFALKTLTTYLKSEKQVTKYELEIKKASIIWSDSSPYIVIKNIKNYDMKIVSFVVDVLVCFWKS